MADAPFTIAALYKFAPLTDLPDVQRDLAALCKAEDIRGTLLLAPEGLNGTISGAAAGVEAVLAHIRTLPGCAELDVKYARADAMPFQWMRVRLKREIVTMRAGDLDPASNAGHYVAPRDWDALIADPETVLIDTRNAYEVAVGTFAGAIDPGTQSFGAFPRWFDAMAARWEAEGRRPRIAMFCTGGIRCEKATAYARRRGFQDVHHLQGGILRYLEEVPQAESAWRGECFVFDERVAVTHGLAVGTHVMCRSCGMPMPQAALADHQRGCRTVSAPAPPASCP
jgi:UPF0176 protein